MVGGREAGRLRRAPRLEPRHPGAAAAPCAAPGPAASPAACRLRTRGASLLCCARCACAAQDFLWTPHVDQFRPSHPDFPRTVRCAGPALPCQPHSLPRLLRLFSSQRAAPVPASPSRRRLFQQLWRRGEPIVLRGLSGEMGWTPEGMARVCKEAPRCGLQVPVDGAEQMHHACASSHLVCIRASHLCGPPISRILLLLACRAASGWRSSTAPTFLQTA